MHQTKFAFLGHHKCATQYVKRICIDVCKILNYSYAMYGHSRLFNHNLPAELESKKVDFLIYTNANYEHFSQIEDQVKAFHVIRDPRDIVVSAYFSHKISHKEQPNLWPELIAYREKLNQVDEEKGLFMEMDFRAEQFEHMLNWNYDSNRVHDIKLEEIMTAPYKTFLKAFEFLDLLDLEGKSYTTLNIKETSNILWRLIKQKTFSSQKNNSQINKVSPELLLSIIYNHRFEKKAKGRKKGSENIKSHYRKGISGDWVNYFNGEHKKYFKEKYNPLLVKLGYEIDHNW